MKTITPSAGRTRNALAMATPSKNVCNSKPTSAEVPASRLTAWVSSPKWKCGVRVCWVKCTARYPARTSAGAEVPERAKASGKSSTTATASMKPAPNATKCSISASSRAARRVTASAPTTLPRAATRAYPSALDTGEEIGTRVAGGILEHLRKQPLQRLPHLGPRPHARLQEIVAFHREGLHGQRVPRRPDGPHDLRERGAGSREQDQQVIGILAHLRQPASYVGNMLRIRILVAPLADGPPALDVLVGGLEPREERGGIGGEKRRDQHRIARELVDGLRRIPHPASRLPDFRQPYPRRPHVDPQPQKFRDPLGCRDPLEPLVPHPLGRELCQPLHVRLRGFEGPRVDPEVEPRAESQRAQDAQVVL